jgi:phage host-nuclease inhibitor protein Gam
MARKRLESPIEDWTAADEVVRKIGQIDREIKAEEAELQKTINEAKAKTAKAVKTKGDQRKMLLLQLAVFAAAHPEEFKKAKTKKLNFGSLGYRWSSKVVLPSGKGAAAKLVADLEALGLKDCVRIKKSPDKDKIKALDAATLAQLGVRLDEKDTFWCEPDLVKIQELEAA